MVVYYNESGENFCPVCNMAINSLTVVDIDREPEDGDFIVCSDCGAWLVFDNGMKIRVVTQEDMDRVLPEVLELLHRTTGRPTKLS